MKLVLSSPPRNSRGEIIPLLVGDFVSINFIGSNEVSALTMKIVEKKIDSGITLVLAESGSAEEHQRRQYFRLSKLEDNQAPGAAESFAMINITVGENSDEPDLAPFKTKLINISGGGVMCAFFDMMPHLNSILKLRIGIPGRPEFTALGKISRIERKEYMGDMVFMTGVTFLEINESDREAVINFVFEQQKSLQKNPGVDLKG